jgi:hypothetical protein
VSESVVKKQVTVLGSIKRDSGFFFQNLSQVTLIDCGKLSVIFFVARVIFEKNVSVTKATALLFICIQV